MRIRFAIIAALGLALTACLAMYVGLGAVISAAAAAGRGGFAVLCLYALGLFLPLGSAWYVLVSDAPSAKLRIFIWARMIRDAATEVLPFSHLGGIALSARTAVVQGISQSVVFGSMMVDVTTETLAQIAYIVLGLAILSLRAPHAAAGAATKVFSLGLLIAAAAGGLLMVIQRHGDWMARKLLSRLLPDAAAATAGVAAAMRDIRRSPARVAISLTLHLSGWIASAVGTWIAFRLVGARADLLPVLSIESLVYALRSAAFFVPNALGVQEAAYAAFAPLFGIGAEFGLAVSLLKRAREIAVGVPILLIWQALESGRMIGRRRGKRANLEFRQPR